MGVYISAEDIWLPQIENQRLFTFDLKMKVPREWKVVTNGMLVGGDQENGVWYFKGAEPTNQVLITANKWTTYSQEIDGVKISVYLMNPDRGLAHKYLGVTGQFLSMYREMIGEFPYAKFDVVENFRETGFGLPSLTLLGQKVMRFPWILFTSYPHELLHNYWGNGVYVDYEKGNWCEGITTYMADFWLKDLKGEGPSYRRDMLQKYSNYVSKENDYSVRQFGTKTDEVSEAIGYAKVLMINQMLRTKLGDDIFKKAYRRFYETNKFRVASFEEIQKAFEEESGTNMDVFFSQWLNRTGAPEISINNVNIRKVDAEWELVFDVNQSTMGEPFVLDIPISIILEGKDNASYKTISLNDFQQEFSIVFDAKPIKLKVDHDFEVMRKLDINEVPPTLSKLMGNRSWTLVLPSESVKLEQYKTFAHAWKGMYSRRGFMFQIVMDTEIEQLPAGRTVWVLGEKNRYANEISASKIYQSHLSTEWLESISKAQSNGVVAYAIRPENHTNAVGFISAQSQQQLMQLITKMMHYGNNSCIGFEGDEMNNTLKGQFPVLKSPLVFDLY